MRNDPISRYCRRVGRQLSCTKSHKKELLSGLRDELMEKRLSEPLTKETLYAAVGTPKEIAAQLMESLDPAEIGKARTQKRRVLVVILSAVLLAVFLLIGYYIHRLKTSEPVYYKEDIYYGNDPALDGFIWGEIVSDSMSDENELGGTVWESNGSDNR